MYVSDDSRGAAECEPACPRRWRGSAAAGTPSSNRGRSTLLGLLAVPVLASILTSTTTGSIDAAAERVMTIPTQLLATYALAPTEVPIISEIHGAALINLLNPYITASSGTPPQPETEVSYPASLGSSSIGQGLAALQTAAAGDPGPVLAGISQGAVVISVYKQAFNEEYANAAPGTIPTPTFVLVGNPSRPNGGLSERLVSLGIPALGGTKAETIPTPTETAGAAPGQVTTYDYARQYDFFSDFPNRPLNLFSTVNALFGAVLSHGSYGTLDSSNGLVGVIIANDPYGTVGPQDAIFEDQVGDTAYYMIPSTTLPMLQPLAFIGVPQPIIAALDAPLRVLVEAGYDRTISPGTPTGIQLLPVANPVKTAIDFGIAIPTGLDDALSELGLGRPFGTTPAGPYGVGGPPVTLPGAVAPATPAVTAVTADVVEGSTAAASTTPTNTLASDLASLVRRVHIPELDSPTDSALTTTSTKARQFGMTSGPSKLASIGSKKTTTDGTSASRAQSTDSSDTTASVSKPRHRA